jgi:hypothetical protein
MDPEIRLGIADEAESLRLDGEQDRLLEDRGADVTAAMPDGPGTADLDRQDSHNRQIRAERVSGSHGPLDRRLVN